MVKPVRDILLLIAVPYHESPTLNLKSAQNSFPTCPTYDKKHKNKTSREI